jgi:Flp pilus assembly protein TadD
VLFYSLLLWGNSLKEGLGKMKAAACVGMALALAGCVTAQQQHQQMAVAVAQCHGEKTPVEWMHCLNEPETRIVGETLLMAYSKRE